VAGVRGTGLSSQSWGIRCLGCQTVDNKGAIVLSSDQPAGACRERDNQDVGRGRTADGVQEYSTPMMFPNAWRACSRLLRPAFISGADCCRTSELWRSTGTVGYYEERMPKSSADHRRDHGLGQSAGRLSHGDDVRPEVCRPKARFFNIRRPNLADGGAGISSLVTRIRTNCLELMLAWLQVAGTAGLRGSVSSKPVRSRWEK